MKRIILTDTGGEPLARFARSAVRRVLQCPVNVTADGPACYALVYCESKAASVERDGRGPRSCVYRVSDASGVVAELLGVQREEAIALFFGLLKGEPRPLVAKPVGAVPAGMLF